MSPMRRGTKPASLLPRLVIVATLAAFAGYLWFGDPLEADERRAAAFCAGLEPGSAVIAIMEAAARDGATGFSSPSEDLLVVAFGKGRCAIALQGGLSAGPAG